jgi:hypothetical protein
MSDRREPRALLPCKVMHLNRSCYKIGLMA